MALFLRESEVESLVSMPMALEAVDDALRALALGEAVDIPRERVRLPAMTQHMLQGALPARRVCGYKVYTSSREGVRFLVYLYHAERGHLEAVLEANALGMVRTGAASGVATRALAREDAAVMGLFGSGWQAIGQLRAVAAVRRLREVKVFARDRERLAAFCSRMADELGIEVRPAANAEETVRGSHVVTTITTAAAPLFDGAWLEPGAHVNAAGSNSLARAELDEKTVRRAAVIAVDAVPTALKEAGDLLGPLERGRIHARQLVELGAVLAGRAPGRTAPDQVTLFESQGLAVQDLALAVRVVARARELGLGSEVPLGA